MNTFEWHVYGSGYVDGYDTEGSYIDVNRVPRCLCSREPDETPRKTTPLQKTSDEGLPLFAALAKTVTDEPKRFRENLLRFTNDWGLWEYDGSPGKEYSAPIRTAHYEGFEPYEDYSPNSLRVLGFEACLLNTLSQLKALIDGPEEKAQKELGSYISIIEEMEGPKSTKKLKEDITDDPIKKLSQALNELEVSHQEQPLHKVQKISFDLKNLVIPVKGVIDRDNILVWIGMNNSISPILELAGRFFYDIKKSELSPDDFKKAAKLIINYFIQQRLNIFPVRLAMDITSSKSTGSSVFLAPQNLLAAAWLQFAGIILKEEPECVYCTHCGEFGFYTSGDWRVRKLEDGSSGYYHKQCYSKRDNKEQYEKRKSEGKTKKKAPS